MGRWQAAGCKRTPAKQQEQKQKQRKRERDDSKLELELELGEAKKPDFNFELDHNCQIIDLPKVDQEEVIFPLIVTEPVFKVPSTPIAKHNHALLKMFCPTFPVISPVIQTEAFGSSCSNVRPMFRIGNDVWRHFIFRDYVFCNHIRRFEHNDLSMVKLGQLSQVCKAFHVAITPLINKKAVETFERVRKFQMEKYGRYLLTDAMCRPAYNYLMYLKDKHGYSMTKTVAFRIFVLDNANFKEYMFVPLEDKGHMYQITDIFDAVLRKYGTVEKYLIALNKRDSRRMKNNHRKEENLSDFIEIINAHLAERGFVDFNSVCEYFEKEEKEMRMELWSFKSFEPPDDTVTMMNRIIYKLKTGKYLIQDNAIRVTKFIECLVSITTKYLSDGKLEHYDRLTQQYMI